MPEGPEVKIVADYLNNQLKRKNIISFDYCSQPYRKKYNYLINRLNQFTPFEFKEVFCIGKTSFLQLDKQNYFSFHLGMTGKWSQKIEKHTHLSIKTQDNKTMYFHDTRRFGNIKLINTQEIESKYFKDRDLLNSDTSIEENTAFLIKNIKSNIEICKILLNQKYFCGVGNYLKSEILYKARIHPHRKWKDLNKNEILQICKFTKKIITESYKSGGAELRDFNNPNKDSSLNLQAYGRDEDSHGRKIKNEITKDNRRTFWCPEIQKLN